MANKKQYWLGTIPLFVFMILIIFGLFAFFFWISFSIIRPHFSIIISSGISIASAIVLFILFLNIPIPRRRKNPDRDLDGKLMLKIGVWCSVFMKKGDDSKVVKQLYFCGWGHNDYRKHKALVIGKDKICGKWNPLVLWFLHYYMILYQMIGLQRRLKFEKQIEALPETYNVSNRKLRYEQKFVPVELNDDSCPVDLHDQFKKLNDELEKSGLYLDDVHLGNVRLTNDGKIKIIDGELYSGGEEWIKSKLVVLFNGEMVSNMEKVLGNERIVAWVDHRKRVNDLFK